MDDVLLHTYIQRFFILMISVGLAQAHPNYAIRGTSCVCVCVCVCRCMHVGGVGCISELVTKFACLYCMHALALIHMVIPVYNRQLYVQPVLLSASTKAFIPHFVGFFGMYCKKDSLPLNPIMDSSIETSLPGWY